MKEEIATREAISMGLDRDDTDYDQGEGTGRKLWSMVNKGPYLAVQIGW